MVGGGVPNAEQARAMFLPTSTLPMVGCMRIWGKPGGTEGNGWRGVGWKEVGLGGWREVGLGGWREVEIRWLEGG